MLLAFLLSCLPLSSSPPLCSVSAVCDTRAADCSMWGSGGGSDTYRHLEIVSDHVNTATLLFDLHHSPTQLTQRPSITRLLVSSLAVRSSAICDGAHSLLRQRPRTPVTSARSQRVSISPLPTCEHQTNPYSVRFGTHHNRLAAHFPTNLCMFETCRDSSTLCRRGL